MVYHQTGMATTRRVMEGVADNVVEEADSVVVNVVTTM
jgi:hypothetical protein